MTLVFDYDGTLHNTAHLYGCAVRKVLEGLREQGYRTPENCSDAELSRYLGVSAPEMWEDFLPELSEEKKLQAAKLVGAEMERGILSGNAELYPGIPEVLDVLQAAGYRMVILSNCGKDYLTAHRKQFGLDHWFSDYYSAGAYDYAPKEAIFQIICREHPDEQYLVIGDRYSDFRVGLVHGCPVIGCAYGFGTPKERSCCNAIAQAPEELAALIGQLEKTEKNKKTS